METARELIDRLNHSDEAAGIEAKAGTAIDRSIMETVCAFSNETGLDGGYLLLGVARQEDSLFPYYEVIKLENLDKLQLDLATQCANSFNQPIRPEIEIEKIGPNSIIKVFIPELPQAQKPVYFKHEGLPRGAYRRIGSSDQRCTDDDLILFYNHNDTFDSISVKGSSWDDVDEDAVELYRTLRAKVSPYAEELNYNDHDLLKSLGCLAGKELTYTGLLVFGSRKAQRRLMPAVRVDYIRVPGNEWVADPENRFTTVDMRGPLLSIVGRAYNAIADDLPKGFLLPDGQIQADSIGLPGKVLREALVNAFIHRSYRVHQPIQIIRYGNRIEIKNPGFSLKPEDRLGEPGSQQRNPFIAAIFHETNLAETKGSGIRTMRGLMEQAGMAPPTFDSDHGNNQFTARLLLHHFLSQDDLRWLTAFNHFQLTDNQKKALIFVREAGAIDNSTYRQLSAVDTLRASSDLRQLREVELLELKGKGRATYYVVGSALKTLIEPVGDLTEPPSVLIEPIPGLSAPPSENSAPVSAPPQGIVHQLPLELRESLDRLGKKCHDEDKIKHFIVELCGWRSLKLIEIAAIMNRQPKYILRKFIQPLMSEGKLQYTIPDMPNHPEQAYRTPDK